ncbi:phage tail protein [Terasakiella sp.]|uniref:phage tail protein n=1 Tax=Terasakiella sp. TaxID=2034861 RepID=UPI003B007D36
MKYSTTSCFSALTLVLATGLLPPSTAQATSQNTYIGTIFYTAANFCPKFSLPPEGQVLDIVQFRLLYSLIGNTYGGNGITEFALPDLRGRSVVGASRMETPNGLPAKPFGYKGGQTSIQLKMENLPAHSHIAALKNQDKPFSTEFYVSTETGSEPTSTPDTWLARKNRDSPI